jgi:hypothetical protein
MTDHSAAAAVWIAANPTAMYQLVILASEAYTASRKIGIGMLVERLRWYGRVESKDSEGYKINNNHRAYIVRELIRRHPQLLHTFDLREVDAGPPTHP